MLSCLTLYLCVFLGLIVVAIASNTFQGNPMDLQSGKLQLRRIPSGVRQASGVSGLKQRLLKQRLLKQYVFKILRNRHRV